MDLLGLLLGLHDIIYIKFGVALNFYDGYLIVDFSVRCTLGARDTKNRCWIQGMNDVPC